MDATTATLIVAIGTFALAGVTLFLALITRGQGDAIREQAGLAREALTVSTRPLLADARPEEARESNIQFGAPMRPSINLPERHGFYFDPDRRRCTLHGPVPEHRCRRRRRHLSDVRA